MSRPRIVYVFRQGRSDRLARSGDHPTELFYGFPQLRRDGWPVSLLEDKDIGMAPPLPPLARAVNALSPMLGGLPSGMVVPLLQRKYRQAINSADLVIATTNGVGLAMAAGRAMDLVRPPVLLLAMGLMPRNPSAVQRRLWTRLLRHVQVAAISRREQQHLSGLLNNQPVHYVPFGVDHHFWFPHPEASGESFVLSIGNDRHRDYETLIAAWKPHYPRLKIVTLQPVANPGVNVDIIRGDWRTQALDDVEIRSLYRQALFVVLPIRQTIQPSGQSSCLQAMACGKAVIFSDIDGLWNRELMRNGETVLLTPPGDVATLAATIEVLLRDPGRAESIGAAARTVIEDHLNVDTMADALTSVLTSVLTAQP